MPPAAQHKNLQITSTDSFAIAHPDEAKSKVYLKRIDRNRTLLEKMMPEMRDRPLNYFIYPCVKMCCNLTDILTSSK